MHLADGRHCLCVAVIDDGRGLRWIVALAIPSTDLYGDLNSSSWGVFFIACSVLIVAIAVISIITLIIRRDLRKFAERIRLIATMNLEDAAEVRAPAPPPPWP